MLQDAIDTMDADDERSMSAEGLAEYMAFLESFAEEEAASADVGCEAKGDAISPPSGSGSQVRVSARTPARVCADTRVCVCARAP